MFTFGVLKAISYILSIYVVFLSMLPCSDGMEYFSAQISPVQQAAEHQNHNDEPELCSPFCKCSCCGISMYTPIALAHITIVNEEYVELSSFAPVFNLEEPASTIWQPPKIG